MLTFATPTLLPLLALLVPLAIYLWNRRPGREVSVGSLRWLAAGANRRLRSLRPQQLPLLLLRLLLLGGLVAALAGPQWRPRRPPGRGQVLVAPALAGSAALAAERPGLDSLRRRGYTLRWLAPGLPPIGPAAWRADSLGLPPDSIRAQDQLRNAPDFYAERVQLAADSLPGQPLLALTPATLRGNAGTRRPLPAGLTWRQLPLPAPATWLHSATATADSLRLVVGQGTENQLTYATRRLKRPSAAGPLPLPGLPLRYQPGPAGTATLTAGADSAVVAQPAALRVWIVSPAARAAEARPLAAALRAAALALPGPLQLTVAAAPPDTAQAPDWLFWLADTEPAPATWRGPLRRGLRLWQFASGPGRPDTAHLAQAGLAAPVALWRRSLAAPPGAVLWRDGLGRPVLTAVPLEAGARYYLATRLAPAWSELAASAELPALLLPLLRPVAEAAGQRRQAAHDPRRLDPAQLLPAGGRRAARPAPAFGRPLALQPWLVLAGAALLALERWLSGRVARRGAAAAGS